jgi:LAGLIDADG DNA endonuclease family protein
VQGADNQQERLDGYIAGYVDGEGSFSVTVNRNPTSKFKLQLVPEFHVSQNGDRREVLDLIKRRLSCGYIKRNGRKDQVMVFVVRRRQDLLTKVIPFFERTPLISSKQGEFETFARVVKAMALGEHLGELGFSQLLELGLSMNGHGRFRQVRWQSLVGHPESSETVRRTGMIPKIQSELRGDMQSRAEMTRPRDRKELIASNRTVGPYPPWAQET